MASAPGESSPTTTVHAPQSPSAQPSLVPVRPAWLRRYSRTVVVAGKSDTDTTSPSSTKRTVLRSAPECGGFMRLTAAIRGVTPRRSQQGHVVILRRVRDAEPDDDFIEKWRLAHRDTPPAKILRDVESQ